MAIVPQEALAQARAIDDRIIYKLNTSIPTESFAGQINAADQCKHLYDEVRPQKYLNTIFPTVNIITWLREILRTNSFPRSIT